MEPVIEIRVLRPGDEPVFDRIAPDVFDHAVRPELIAEFLHDSRHHLAAAMANGVMVGFASGLTYVHPDKPVELWVNEVSVALEYRRRGIARQLLAALFSVGRSAGCRKAWVGTERTNAPAMALYASMKGSLPPVDFVSIEFDL